MVEFRKADSGTFYYVYDGDKLLGGVRKGTDWVVRGSRVYWEAFHKGRVVGRAETRKAAADLLRQPRLVGVRLDVN